LAVNASARLRSAAGRLATAVTASLDLRERQRRISRQDRSDDPLAPQLTVDASIHLNDSLSR